MTGPDLWGERAACRGVDPELFHAKTAAGQQHAITTWCLDCPVRAECLADALDLGADRDYGVRGGTTRLQRLALRKRPNLPTGQTPATIAALRQLLDAEQPNCRPTPVPAPRPRRRAPKETTVPETTAPTQAAEPQPAPAEPEKPTASAPEPTAPIRHISDLLTWGERHTDTNVQKFAKQARAALTVLEQRHAHDAELQRVRREAEELRQRLADLDARAKQLAPTKAKAQRDYDPAEVRAWARMRGMACPPFGVVPKTVVEAWRERGAA